MIKNPYQENYFITLEIFIEKFITITSEHLHWIQIFDIYIKQPILDNPFLNPLNIAELKHLTLYLLYFYQKVQEARSPFLQNH
jgi:hypothetical protein